MKNFVLNALNKIYNMGVSICEGSVRRQPVAWACNWIDKRKRQE